jgi:hypothetical protein
LIIIISPLEATMAQKAGAQISRKAFLQSFFISLALMILAGDGLASVSDGMWLNWPLKLRISINSVTLIFLATGAALQFGSF